MQFLIQITIFRRILSLIKKWVNEDEETLRTLCDTLCENPDEHRSRIVNIVDYIDQEAFDEKVLLFTGYLGTFDVYRRTLNNYFGEEHCCFFAKVCQEMNLNLMHTDSKIIPSAE